MVFMQKLNLSVVFEHIAGDNKISTYRGCRILLSPPRLLTFFRQNIRGPFTAIVSTV